MLDWDDSLTFGSFGLFEDSAVALGQMFTSGKNSWRFTSKDWASKDAGVFGSFFKSYSSLSCFYLTPQRNICIRQEASQFLKFPKRHQFFPSPVRMHFGGLLMQNKTAKSKTHPNWGWLRSLNLQEVSRKSPCLHASSTGPDCRVFFFFGGGGWGGGGGGGNSFEGRPYRSLGFNSFVE